MCKWGITEIDPEVLKENPDLEQERDKLTKMSNEDLERIGNQDLNTEDLPPLFLIFNEFHQRGWCKA